MEGGHGIRVLLTGNVGVNLAWERPRRLLERSNTFRMERGTGDGMSSRVEWGDGRDVAMRKRSKVAARVVLTLRSSEARHLAQDIQLRSAASSWFIHI